jgi:uncharacterized UPF0160 family protein
MDKYYLGPDPEKTLEDLVRKGRSEGFYTHAGLMHSDDILTWSTLIACDVNPGSIHRVASADPSVGVVFDIGGGYLDHHQPNAKVKDDGTKYAALGLLFFWYGLEIIARITGEMDNVVLSAALDKVRTFIDAMDKTDNYGPKKYPNTLGRMINAMRDKEYNDRTIDSTFINIACDMSDYMVALVQASVEEARNEVAAVAKINEALETHKTFIDNTTGCFVPASLLVDTGIHFVLNKDLRVEGHYTIVSADAERWPLSCVAGEAGCVFIHPARFLATFDSLEHAVGYLLGE